MRSLKVMGAAGLMATLALTACVANDVSAPSPGVSIAAVTTTTPTVQEPSMNTPSDTSADEATIRELSSRQTAAVLAGDVETLDELLADGFTATHVTGYEHSKKDWLAQMTSGQMQYHASTEVSWDVTINGDTAVIASRSRVDATIYGSRRVWPLASTTYLRKVGGRWVIEKSVASTF